MTHSLQPSLPAPRSTSQVSLPSTQNGEKPRARRRAPPVSMVLSCLVPVHFVGWYRVVQGCGRTLRRRRHFPELRLQQMRQLFLHSFCNFCNLLHHVHVDMHVAIKILYILAINFNPFPYPTDQKGQPTFYQMPVRSCKSQS